MNISWCGSFGVAGALALGQHQRFSCGGVRGPGSEGDLDVEAAARPAAGSHRCAALLAGSGGAAGALLGGFATAVYSWTRQWSAVVPVPVLLAAVGIALIIGAVAGVYPAWRAARLTPAEALRMV
jgi:hypothetical protein